MPQETKCLRQTLGWPADLGERTLRADNPVASKDEAQPKSAPVGGSLFDALDQIAAAEAAAPASRFPETLSVADFDLSAVAGIAAAQACCCTSAWLVLWSLPHFGHLVVDCHRVDDKL